MTGTGWGFAALLGLVALGALVGLVALSAAGATTACTVAVAGCTVAVAGLKTMVVIFSVGCFFDFRFFVPCQSTRGEKTGEKICLR